MTVYKLKKKSFREFFDKPYHNHKSLTGMICICLGTTHLVSKEMTTEQLESGCWFWISYCLLVYLRWGRVCSSKVSRSSHLCVNMCWPPFLCDDNITYSYLPDKHFMIQRSASQTFLEATHNKKPILYCDPALSLSLSLSLSLIHTHTHVLSLEIKSLSLNGGALRDGRLN